MLRVNSRDVLVVPPFECAWLELQDYGVDGGCCLCFETRGDNDVTVIFKSVAGAKRWQPLARPAGGAAGAAAAVEENYTVILGSHRNSCLKFEKNGETMELVRGVAGSKVGGREFSPFWVNVQRGAITVGAGAPGERVAHRWVDAAPGPLAESVRHAGLSCWDRHVSYRNVKVLPPLDAAQLQAAAEAAAAVQAEAAAAQATADAAADSSGCACSCAAADAAAAGPAAGGSGAPLALPSCFDAASAAVVAALTPSFACDALAVAELLLPASEGVYRAAAEYVGRNFQQCADEALEQLSLLSAPALADILTEPLLSVREYTVFEVVASWACYGQPQGWAHAAPAAACGGPGSSAAGEASGSGSSGRDTACDGGASSSLSSGTAVDDGGGSGRGSGSGSGSEPPDPGESSGPAAAGAAAEPGGGSGAAAGGGSSSVARRPALELALVVPLVRFMLMSKQDLEAAAAHPFVRANPLVQQHMAAELARAQSAASGAAAAGHYTFERRRIVRPAAAAAGSGAGSGGEAEPGGSPQHAQRAQHAQQADALRPRYQRRLAPAGRELMYVYDGDQNGVVAHIATDYGTRQWVNPVLARRLDVRASSPASRFTDPKALVSGTFPRTSFACPRFEAGGAPATWWLVDLGPGHRLLCNYYTMRADGSSDFPRHWVLQASNDLSHWVDLRRHIGDASLKLPGQYASWPVAGPASQLPFRAFRLLLAGPTTSAATPWNFNLAAVEFYGYFYRAGGASGANGGGVGAGAGAPSGAG